MRSLSSVARERQALLRKIYAPFARLDDKSPEYMVLARSGKVWEDFFRPADSEKQGYMRMQRVSTSFSLTCFGGLDVRTHPGLPVVWQWPHLEQPVLLADEGMDLSMQLFRGYDALVRRCSSSNCGISRNAARPCNVSMISGSP